MFSKNEYIIYGSTGACKIIDIVIRKFGFNQERKYYVLKPAYENNSTIYAPIDNDKVTIRKIMTKEEVYNLIKTIPNNETIWIDDNNLRKETYNEILRTGNKKEIIKLIRTLHQQRISKKEVGKKLNVGDEKIMNEAEKLLHEEFALVLNIKVDEVLPFISGELSPEGKGEFSF